jgi:hypothetical protein
VPRQVLRRCHPTRSLFAWLISHQPAVLFSQNKPTTSNQPAVLFSQNKPAPAISHQPNEQADAHTSRLCSVYLFFLTFCISLRLNLTHDLTCCIFLSEQSAVYIGTSGLKRSGRVLAFELQFLVSFHRVVLPERVYATRSGLKQSSHIHHFYTFFQKDESMLFFSRKTRTLFDLVLKCRFEFLGSGI